MLKHIARIIPLFMLSVPTMLPAQENTEHHEKSLLTISRHPRLENIGIQLQAGYIGEFWANTRGGIKRGQTHLHEIDLSVTLDTEGAGLWSNGEFFLQLLSQQGGDLLSEEFVGDCQTVSNIETAHSSRLHQLWYEQSLLNEKLSLLFGIHDFNSDFAVNEHGSHFINSAFGLSSDVAMAARPCTFPLAAPGIRARFTPHPSWEFLLGVYNGNPGDPVEQKHLPKLDFDNRAGALLAIEVAYHYSRAFLPGTVKFGYWKNTGTFEDLLNVDSSGNPVEHKGNHGWYLIADKKITAENHGSRGLGAFLQLGWTPKENLSPFDTYIGAGMHYTGLIPHRDEDETGIAVARAGVNDKIRFAAGRERAETTLEITYRAVLHPNVALQPDLQFIINPGADPDLRDAIAAGVRLELAF
ncbi:MAG: carbohydrate porin [Acidobacteria bacterium]|nr:carbohydrate porin [Acidobacteriota bacterium]